MKTVFSDSLFIKSELFTQDGANKIICTLKNQSGRFIADLLRNDSKGFCYGRLIEPYKTPEWLVPGLILNGIVNGMKLILTTEPVIQTRIKNLETILGDRVNFSYVVTTEFKNGNERFENNCGFKKF